MAYMDEHGGRDSDRTNESLHRPDGGENVVPEGHATEKETTETTAERIVEGKQSRKPKGLLDRARGLLFGDKTPGERAKAGFLGWKASGLGSFENVIKAISSPKALTALVMSTGIGLFSILGIFNTYKNDDIIKNDPPLKCVQSEIDLPAPGGGSGDDMDVQEVVNIMYDIFVNEFGYTDSDLVGMVACMLVETGCNPDRLESDYVGPLVGAKEVFDSIAGPEMSPTAEEAIAAYEAYCSVYATTSGVTINSGYMTDEGGPFCGIGLIQWTAGRARNFIMGLDSVSLDVSPMSVQYQCAYLIAEAVKHYPPWAPGGDRTGNTNDDVATTNFFGTMVFGHMPEAGNEYLAGRLARVAEARAYVDAASANSEFTMDAVTMYEELSEESFSAQTAAASVNLQLCINSTFIVNTDIANAAVSISFLERGDYEDVNGAYGGYRRSARSPNIINDWDWIEGQNRDIGSLSTPKNTSTYGAARGVTSTPKKNWAYYDTSLNTAGGKLDLIACTEYYYFAHLIAFPRETGTGGQAGYFSSCDRGTATAVRIAGADDKFPAGNPLYQLNWAIGAAKQSSHHNENAYGTQNKGFLWAVDGFLRGSDYYSTSGKAAIPAGTVMITWSVRAANDMLNENSGGATESGDGGMLDGDWNEADDPTLNLPDEDPVESAVAARKLANLRFPMSVANSTRHIITYVGDATVNSFWGIDWLYQQWQLFDDADSLIRRDLTEEIPEIMSVGLSVKSSFASKSSDPHMTFYMAKALGAQDNKDMSSWKPANGRMMEFNAKTGLPEFHAWEQIFVRLIHDSDDDASLSEGGATGSALYEKIGPNGNGSMDDHSEGDGYLDAGEFSIEDTDIEQYAGVEDGNNKELGYTYHNKAFYQDWNSVGEGSVSTRSTNIPSSNHKYDYADIEDPKLLMWYDDTDGDSTVDPVLGDLGYNWTHENGAEGSPYWRYELVTDIEYRTNQFLRFGLASLMCSLPSEEDADTYQTGGEGNQTGHILGNLYRRYSRIPDKIDPSGRYYYYNTVVSNDMLQDLTQLYVEEKNNYAVGLNYATDSDVETYGKNERNYGPMYLVPLNRVYNSEMIGQGTSSQKWYDRRYGLTAGDIAYIMDGIEGNKMGELTGKEANDAFHRILTEPMHLFSDQQLALYDNTKNAGDGAYFVNSAHESPHLYNGPIDQATIVANELDPTEADIQPYKTEIYGMNPFLMLEAAKRLNVVGNGTSDTGLSDDNEYNANELDWEADGAKEKLSVRNDIYAMATGVTGSGYATTAFGVDPTSEDHTMDDRLAWIDRHYYVTDSGAIGTFAYQVMALMPSAGTKMDLTAKTYDNYLRSVKTLNAGHNGQSYIDRDTLLSSKGLVQYTDFIYAENATDNKEMAKRLFGKDDRNRDNATGVDGARDDYNRREFILIPYVHTHSQQCDHSLLYNGGSGYSHYDVNYEGEALDDYFCRWQEDVFVPSVADNMTLTGTAMIDTQVALNGSDTRKLYQQSRLSGDYECEHEYDDEHDYGETISFNETHVKNRGKYDVNQLLATVDNQTVRYFADTGDEIFWNDKPIIHVECDGWYQWGKCYGGGCGVCDPCDCGPSGSSCGEWVCHACGETRQCYEYCYHTCAECIANDWCHDHKECDDSGSVDDLNGHDSYDCPEDCSGGSWDDHIPAGADKYHHLDGGHVDNSLQSDKCHYEYGCNALEYLYHNTDGKDGPRTHYRHDPTVVIPSRTASGSTGYYDATTEGYGSTDEDASDEAAFTAPSVTYETGTYTVENLYMVIPVSRNVNMNDFDIRDYIPAAKYNSETQEWSGTWLLEDGSTHANKSVKCDKDNLIQQVAYDENGWVTYNWLDMVNPAIEGSFRNPDTGSDYIDAVKVSEIKTDERHIHNGSLDQPFIGHPGKEWDTDEYDYESGPGLLQYFTIEGDSIHWDRNLSWQGYLENQIEYKYGTIQCEYIDYWKLNGTKDDLVALDPIRNRVGYGKDTTQYWSVQDDERAVSQNDGPGIRFGSSSQPIQFASSWYTEDSTARKVATGYATDGLGNYGWGEVAVVGTQHPMTPTESDIDYGLTAYHGGDGGASGPDGSLGNAKLPFGPSLLREVIGDEHVFHVKFDTQDYAGLTAQDKGDNGRDFVFYVSKEWAKRYSGDDDIKPKDYQREGTSYFNYAISRPNEAGAFRSMDRTDGQYINYFTGELTDNMYTENIPPYNTTNNFEREGTNGVRSSDGHVYNVKNWPANAVVSRENDGATNGEATSQKVSTWVEEDNKDPRGGNDPISGAPIHAQVTSDYRNWVAHASRGTRGMMTAYMNFGSFFGDVYANDDGKHKTNAYMLFTVVERTDIMTSEDGGQDWYGYPMGSDNADAAKDRWDDTRKDDGPYTGLVTKQESFVYKTPPGDAVLGTNDLHYSWGYGENAGFSDTYGQGSNSHWKNMIDLYNAAMSVTRVD